MSSTPSRASGSILGPGVVIAAAVLLTLASYFVSVNEYVSVFGAEMAGAYDCDGPELVLILAAGGILCGVFGMVWSSRTLWQRRTLGARVALAVAMIVVVVATARIMPAIAEGRRNAAPDSPCH